MPKNLPKHWAWVESLNFVMLRSQVQQNLSKKILSNSNNFRNSIFAPGPNVKVAQCMNLPNSIPIPIATILFQTCSIVFGFHELSYKVYILLRASPILKLSIVWVSVKWDIKVKVVLNKGEYVITQRTLKVRNVVGQSFEIGRMEFVVGMESVTRD